MATPIPHLSRRLLSSACLFRISELQRRGICQITRLPRPFPRQIHCSPRFFAAQAVSTSNNEHQVPQPAQLTQSDYHKQSDAYIDSLVEVLEEVAESNAAMDVEYHSGVLNLIFPPAGTYVINKQPPNNQIWLSSPISGPKRYDFVRDSDGKGSWIYLRDGSSLTTLLNDELELNFEPPEVD